MNISIFSGGTGSIALQNGLKTFFPNCKITNIINGYDDGKSTGICRKIFDVLGPSDIRKNQWTQYKNKTPEVDEGLVDLFESRLDFTIDNYKNLECVFEWDTTRCLKYLIPIFIEKAQLNGFTKFEDFNPANIVYATMFKQHGYQYTINFFKEFLNIDDDVVLTSHTNSVLKGLTKNKILETEAEIVEYNNADDPIIDIKFDINPDLNPNVVSILEKSDLIIFSSGTQWSSLIPSYVHFEIMDFLKKTNKMLVFILNNTQDKDMKGIDAKQLVSYATKLLPLEKMHIIGNKDADDNLKMDEFNVTCAEFVYASLENNNGKHNPFLLGREILKIFIKNNPPKRIILDFDDTIWARDITQNKLSEKNIDLIEKLSNRYLVSIASGNHEKNIYKKAPKLKTIKLEYFISCGGAWNVLNEKPIKNEFKIDEIKIIKVIKDILPLGVEFENRNGVCLSIKPVLKNRMEFVNKINDIFYEHNLDCVAMATGLTTIDIISIKADKTSFLDVFNIDDFIFIGDSCLDGNDFTISKRAEYCCQVFNITETTEILKILTCE